MILMQAYALLCALAVLSCSATLSRWQQGGYWLAGLLVGLLLFSPALLGLPFASLQVPPEQLALLLLLLAGTRIARGVSPQLLLFCAGLLVHLWMQGLLLLGYPLVLALLLVFGACIFTMMACLHKPGFRTESLLHEAFLLLMAGGLALALLPELLRGWDHALGLQSVGGEGLAAATDVGLGKESGVLWIAALCVALGILRALWSSRSKTRPGKT